MSILAGETEEVADLGDVDGLDGYVPPPYQPPPTLDERLVKAWREITQTPGRAALAMADLCAIAGFMISLRTIPVTTADPAGPLRAQCGISYYVAGAPNRAVDQACRYAFAGRIPELVLCALVALGATAVLVRSIARPAAADRTSGLRHMWQEVTRTPGRAALATFDVAALVALVAALQPVTVVTADPAGPIRARCGVQYFVLGVGDAAVRHTCRTAYGPRASAFFITLVALVVGVAGLVRTTRRQPAVGASPA